jgi:phosphoribosylformimino-5-aminoimidazole carboxamide ribonucleotide (ProFAR) isomerase
VNLGGVIVGRALYEGAFSIGDALTAVGSGG